MSQATELVVGTVDRVVMEVPVEKIRRHDVLPIPLSEELEPYTVERLVWALYHCPGIWAHADKEVRDCLVALAYRVAQKVNVYPFIAEILMVMDKSKPAAPARVPALEWVPYDPKDRYWFEGDAVDVTEREQALLDAERAKGKPADEGMLA